MSLVKSFFSFLFPSAAMPNDVAMGMKEDCSIVSLSLSLSLSLVLVASRTPVVFYIALVTITA